MSYNNKQALFTFATAATFGISSAAILYFGFHEFCKENQGDVVGIVYGALAFGFMSGMILSHFVINPEASQVVVPSQQHEKSQ